MLLRNLDLLFDDPALFFLVIGSLIIALLIALTVHEFGHAFVANRLGDPTASSMGRLSLNPARHLTPVGTLMIFLIGFGWGKPVPVDYRRLRPDPKRGMLYVALAGAVFNLSTAALFGLLIRVGVFDWHSPGYVPYVTDWGISSISGFVLGYVIFLNIILGVFNLLPVAPLDGSKVIIGLLPDRYAYQIAQIEKYGPLLLIGIILLSYTTGFLWDILFTPVDIFVRIFVGQPFYNL